MTMEEEKMSESVAAKTEDTLKKTISQKKKMGGGVSASEESASKYPDMEVCQKIHRLIHAAANDSENPLSEEMQKETLNEIGVELENAHVYQQVVQKLKEVSKDVYPNCDPSSLLSTEQLDTMAEKHKTTLKELEEKVAEAKESAGDMEVMDARIEVARFCSKSLSQEDALDAYTKLLDLPKLSSGKKIDSLMEASRVASFHGDIRKSDDYIDRAFKMATEGGGGDWDRRNRLKVYRALSKLLSRDIKGAANLLIDCIATFSCNEICSYQDFIVYAILTNLLHIPRPELKEKIIDGPEIISVAKDIPVVIELVKSLYDCDYKTYLNSMVEMENILFNDRYLSKHVNYWMRELHILAYKQFLDSYQSVTLVAMGEAFGVSTDFIDYHASRFIASGRLSAKIDKYGGVIITNRPDLKNAQYREMIQKGDLLLNRIQKLARVVDL